MDLLTVPKTPAEAVAGRAAEAAAGISAGTVAGTAAEAAAGISAETVAGTAAETGGGISPGTVGGTAAETAAGISAETVAGTAAAGVRAGISDREAPPGGPASGGKQFNTGTQARSHIFPSNALTAGKMPVIRMIANSAETIDYEQSPIRVVRRRTKLVGIVVRIRTVSRSTLHALRARNPCHLRHRFLWCIENAICVRLRELREVT